MLSTQLTDTYFELFAQKDAAALAELLAEDVQLKDPNVGAVFGKKAVMEVNQGIFDNFDIELVWKKTFLKGENSVAVEFALDLVDGNGQATRVEGVDCIEVQNSLITQVIGYVLANPIWHKDEA